MARDNLYIKCVDASGRDDLTIDRIYEGEYVASPEGSGSGCPDVYELISDKDKRVSADCKRFIKTPECAVHGCLGYKGICGKIIVGDKSICGAEVGTCEHQVTN